MNDLDLYRPCSDIEIEGIEVLPGYRTRTYFECFTRGSKYVIIRPDLIIFAVAQTSFELEKCLGLLNTRVYDDTRKI
jgi:hypothetical protein